MPGCSTGAARGHKYCLERALNARPPKEVAKALVGRIRSVKHAPRANEAGCAALEASLRREARSFAVQDAASAEKVGGALRELPEGVRDLAAADVLMDVAEHVGAAAGVGAVLALLCANRTIL